MLKNTKIRLFALLSGIFLVAAGCGGGSNSGSTGPVVLNIWGTFETQANMMPFIQAYQQQYPNVQINYTQKNVDTYESDLLNALASGTGPDIFAIHNDWLPKYEDKLVPATAKAYSLSDFKNTFVDVVYNDFVDQGKIYAAPLSVDSLGLYYNKDILGSVGIAVPPATWAQLQNDVKKITRRAGFNITRSGVAMGTSTNINRAVDIVSLLMLQDHVVPYSQDFSRATFDQATLNSQNVPFYPAADALSFYTSFANPASDVYTWSSNSNYSVDAFANGQLAFMYGYSYMRDIINQKSPNLNYDVAPVPQPDTNGNLVNFANYWGFGVSKQSKNPNYAWSFISFMTQKQNLENYYKLHNLPSSRRDIIAEQISDPNIGVFASENLTAKSLYKKDQSKFDAIFLNMIDDVNLRGKSVTDAISNATQQINLLAQQQFTQ